MRHEQLGGLADAMERRFAKTRASNKVGAAIRAGRAFCRRNGIRLNPIGNDDRKTAAPGTYRPIGGTGNGTCPKTCPYLEGCYGLDGNCRGHQKRAAPEREGAEAAAAVAMVAGALGRDRARLHVTGDGTADGVTPDVTYWLNLARISRWVRERYGVGGAWTYTHIDPELFEPLHGTLLEAGIAVRYSDQWGRWGAITLPFDRVREFRFLTGIPTVKCPAQLRKDVNCLRCRLCWEQPDSVIAFNPHGSLGSVRKVTVASPALRFLNDNLKPHSDVDRQAVVC